MKTKKALVIGHDKNSPGAYSNILRTSEYIYNSEVAYCASHIADIHKRPLVGGYTSQMRELANQLNPKNYDIIGELHFNKFDNKDNNKGVGCEAVIYPGNKNMRRLGNIYCDYISKKYDIPNRGVKEHGKGERGYGFLSMMQADAIIFEPFFGDESEALKFKNPEEYAADLEEIFKIYEANN